jgi:acetyl esterase/lipase
MSQQKETLRDPFNKGTDATSLLDTPDPEYYAVSHSVWTDARVALTFQGAVQRLEELMPILATAPKDSSDLTATREWTKTEWYRLPREIEAPRFQSPIKTRSEDVTITYDGDKTFRVRVYEPDVPGARSLPALIVLHGGGWVHGHLDTDDETSKYFCSELRAVVINVDYSLAPEHPFPAAHNDVLEVLNWVRPCLTLLLSVFET